MLFTHVPRSVPGPRLSHWALARAMREDPIGFLMDVAHDTRGVAYLGRRGTRPCFFVSDPETVATVLARWGSAQQHVRASGRSAMNGAFSNRALDVHARDAATYTDEAIARFREFHGQTIDIGAEMLRLLFRIMVRVITGNDVGDAYALQMALGVCADHERDAAAQIFPNWAYTLVGANSAFHNAEDVLDLFVRSCIRDTLTHVPDHGEDILSHVVRTMQGDATGVEMHDLDRLGDFVRGLLVTTHATTATTLAWLFVELGGHPKIQERIRTEAAHLATRGAITTRDLPFLHRVVATAWRDYPAEWVVERVTTAPVEIGGVALPKESRVIVSPFVIERMWRWNRTLYRFDPMTCEAHTPSDAFGALAQRIAHVVIAKLVRATNDIELSPADHVARFDARTLLRPSGGVPVKLFFRE